MKGMFKEWREVRSHWNKVSLVRAMSCRSL